MSQSPPTVAPPEEPYDPLPELQGPRPWYLPRTFDGLRFRPFRFYMGAMIWWNAAMSMQMLVRGYLAFNLTDSFTSLGVVGLGSALPMLLLSPLGGVIADRTSKRLVLQLGQVFSFVIAVVVAALLFNDMLTFWHLFAASVAQGTMGALVMPSRQALLPEVVGMRRLMNAIPLQTAGMNLMQIMAPTLGGFFIDWFGAEWVYVFMAAMYSMSVFMLFFVQTLSAEEIEASRVGTATEGLREGHGGASDEDEGTLAQLRGGFAYLRRDRTVLSILAFTFIGSVLGMPIRMLLPGYVSDIFGEDGSTLGLLQMGMGVGALFGALVLASLQMAHRRGMLLAGSAILMGVSMIGFALTHTMWMAWLALMVVGIGSAGRQTLGQVLVQEYVDDDYRGRVMAIFMMQFSLMSLGTFIVSLYMEKVGPEFALGSLGAVLVATTLVFVAVIPRIRRLD
jgi:MFS family permease